MNNVEDALQTKPLLTCLFLDINIVIEQLFNMMSKHTFYDRIYARSKIEYMQVLIVYGHWTNSRAYMKLQNIHFLETKNNVVFQQFIMKLGWIDLI